MKNMNPEIFATLSIIIVCWIILLVSDAAVCGILKLLFGIKFRKAFLWGLLSLFIPPLTVAYGSLIERNWFKIRKITIECETLPASFDGYSLIHISDIHARSFQGREQRLQRAVDRMNGLLPDMVAFSGDLITMTPDELEAIGGILGGLKAKDGVYSVLGNHDYSMYSDMGEEGKGKAIENLITLQRNMGWNLLMNENKVIGRGRDSIAVVGVKNTSPSKHFPSKGNLPQAASGTEGMFRILLSHDPLHWEAEVVGQDFPLTLSGHTHAMQFSLLGWSPSRLMFPQYRGLYNTGDTAHTIARGAGTSGTCADHTEMTQKAPQQYLYVNPGLGETIFPARIGVRPEITLITLKSPGRH